VKENLYRLILEASKSREAMRKLEASLTLLPKEEAMAYRLAARSLTNLVKKKGSIKKTKEVLEAVLDERVLDEFDKAFLDFFKWLSDEEMKES